MEGEFGGGGGGQGGVKKRPENSARQKMNVMARDERGQAVSGSTANKQDLPVDDMKGMKGNERSRDDESLLVSGLGQLEAREGRSPHGSDERR